MLILTEVCRIVNAAVIDKISAEHQQKILGLQNWLFLPELNHQGEKISF
jgi:hypothetical protein